MDLSHAEEAAKLARELDGIRCMKKNMPAYRPNLNHDVVFDIAPIVTLKVPSNTVLEWLNSQEERIVERLELIGVKNVSN